ncbi:glycosyl hydrolase family 28-related protein [Azotobacter beijerinckii]|uniref:Polygalacturonase n=1 Tax=Azotobacter beijerinckii TaxID=170623 RepID=A0A1I3ZU71_9GAMM|nr:glycosyl hydrolase family 28-related protein [Azotobacter beijerinckii]SFA85494.1 Polygalacturonase [Azotobacter beijerinckii]SFK47645.1 Polygalacturonase [Azotobacter beijerinckii]
MEEGDEYHNTVDHSRRVFVQGVWAVFLGASTADLANAFDPQKGAGMSGFSHAVNYPAGTLGAHARNSVSVKDAPFNAKGDGVTNDTAAIQAAADFLANGGVLHFPAGRYYITEGISVNSGTHVLGCYGKSVLVGCAAADYTGGTVKQKGAGLYNKNFMADVLTDSDICIENMVFDFDPMVPANGQSVGVYMRYVSRIKTLSCIQYGGENLSGYMHCRDTRVSDCAAYECQNAAYDAWASSGNIIVSNNIAKNETTSSNQSIQVTADDTDKVTWALLGTGHCEKIVIEGNIVDVIPDDTNVGIILNCLSAGPTISDAVINGNYVRGAHYGIVLQGGVSQVNITGNVIKDTHDAGVLLFTRFLGNAADSPSHVLVSGNALSNCAPGFNAIDVRNGDSISVVDNKISVPKNITTVAVAGGLTNSGTVATFVSATPHGLNTGDTVAVSGAVETGYNDVVAITKVNDTTFTYPVVAGLVSPATTAGTIQATTSYSRGIYVRNGVTNSLVNGNAIDGGTYRRIVMNGDTNLVNPGKIYYSRDKVFDGVPPSTVTALSCKSASGLRGKNICRALVYNATGSSASFVFSTPGDSIESTLTQIGVGASVSTMQNGEHQYVTFVTDDTGTINWVSTVGAGVVKVYIVSFQRITSEVVKYEA